MLRRGRAGSVEQESDEIGKQVPSLLQTEECKEAKGCDFWQTC